MKTREILSIVALAALGLCLLCGLAKMAMKNPKAKQSCDHACSLLVFVAVVLVGVSQLIEEEGYKELDLPYWEPGVGALPWTFSGEGKMKKKKMSMGLGDSGNGITCSSRLSGYPDGTQVGCCVAPDVSPDGTETGCCDQSNCVPDPRTGVAEICVGALSQKSQCRDKPAPSPAPGACTEDSCKCVGAGTGTFCGDDNTCVGQQPGTMSCGRGHCECVAK